MKKIITYLELGCLVVGSGISAFAATDDDSGVDTTPAARHEEEAERFEGLLDSLVEDGELDEDTVDSILSYIEEKKEEMSQRPEKSEGEKPERLERPEGDADAERPERPEGKGQRGHRGKGSKGNGILENLVEEEIITEEEAELIEEAGEELKAAERSEKLDEILENLIDEGTIDEDQKDEIGGFLEEKAEEKEAEREAVEAMTDEERQEYFEEKREEGKGNNAISEMVENGIITEEQAEALKELMPKHHGAKGGKRPGKGQKPALNQEGSDI